MARIEGVSPRTWSPLFRLSAWFMRRRVGRNVEPLRGYARSRPVLLALGGLELGMERATRVDPQLRGLAELRVAALVGCEFCLDIGSAVVRKLGVSDAKLRGLGRHGVSDAFTPLEQAVLDYADRMTATPATVRDEDVARLRGFLDEPQLVELTAAIAHENLRARMNHALGYEAEGFSAGALCVLPVREDVTREAAPPYTVGRSAGAA
jgi:AhpD family alkylhydroperoxidase